MNGCIGVHAHNMYVNVCMKELTDREREREREKEREWGERVGGGGKKESEI